MSVCILSASLTKFYKLPEDMYELTVDARKSAVEDTQIIPDEIKFKITDQIKV